MLQRRDFLKLAGGSLCLSALPGCGSQEAAVLSPSSAGSAAPPEGPQILLNRVLAFDEQGVAYLLEPSLYRLSRLDELGGVVWQLGDASTGQGIFNVPVNLESDHQGRLYVVDQGNAEIDVISDQGQPLAVIGRGQLRSLRDIAIELTQPLLFASEGAAHRIAVFTLDGQLVRRFGSKGSGPSQLLGPDGIDVSPDGLIHVVDRGNARVQVFTRDGQWLRSYGQRGSNLGEFNLPGALVISAAYQIFVGDAIDGFVTQFDDVGRPVSRFRPILPDGRRIHPEHLHLTPAAGRKLQPSLGQAVQADLIISGSLAFAGA